MIITLTIIFDAFLLQNDPKKLHNEKLKKSLLIGVKSKPAFIVTMGQNKFRENIIFFQIELKKKFESNFNGYFKIIKIKELYKN